MTVEARMNASGMAHLLASLSVRIHDADALGRIEQALADYCRLNDHCELVRCSGGSFSIEPRDSC